MTKTPKGLFLFPFALLQKRFVYQLYNTFMTGRGNSNWSFPGSGNTGKTRFQAKGEQTIKVHVTNAVAVRNLKEIKEGIELVYGPYESRLRKHVAQIDSDDLNTTFEPRVKVHRRSNDGEITWLDTLINKLFGKTIQVEVQEWCQASYTTKHRLGEDELTTNHRISYSKKGTLEKPVFENVVYECEIIDPSIKNFDFPPGDTKVTLLIATNPDGWFKPEVSLRLSDEGKQILNKLGGHDQLLPENPYDTLSFRDFTIGVSSTPWNFSRLEFDLTGLKIWDIGYDPYTDKFDFAPKEPAQVRNPYNRHTEPSFWKGQDYLRNLSVLLRILKILGTTEVE